MLSSGQSLLSSQEPRSKRVCALQIAVRSDEPYRLQCYGFMTSLAAPGPHGPHDVFGAFILKLPVC